MTTHHRALIGAFGLWLGILATAIAAPANDNFASSAALTGLPVATSGNNSLATLEAGEPMPYDESPESSVWFDWTAPASGPVRIDTDGSDFDTVLAVWSGTSLNSLTEIASNDDHDDYDTAVFLTVQAGVHYRIAVYGYNEDDTGNFNLHIVADTSPHIHGKVTEMDGITPLPGIQVTAYQWDEDDEGWRILGSSLSVPDGNYDIGGLHEGNHRLRFSERNENHLTEYYNDAATLATGQDVAVPALGIVTGINAALAVNSKITGTVTGPDGIQPLGGIDVYAYQWDSYDEYWDVVASAETEPDGTYIISGLRAGAYRIRILDDDYEYYLGEYYDDVETIGEAVDIVVPASSVVSGIDASLSEGSRIAGVVTGPDGAAPLAGIRVVAYKLYDGDWDFFRSVHTLADGSYAIRGLSGGIYRLGFSDDDGGFRREYYNDVSDIQLAANVSVPADTVVGGINASLALASRIAGTVTGPDAATPLEGIDVVAYRWDPDTSDWEYFSEDETDGDGHYGIGGLTPGTYRIRFSDRYNGIHLAGYFDDAATLETATDIVVPAQTHVENIDASLGERPRISGTVTGPDGVTPLEDIRVVAYVWDEDEEYWDDAGYATTEANGGYVIRVPAAGTYRIGFSDYGGVHLREFYQNSATLGGAADVAVAALSETSGINASLALASRITGTVTGPGGPLEDVEVTAYLMDEYGDWEDEVSTYTGADGKYSLTGLESGTYRISFDDDGLQTHVREYYDNAETIGAATDIAVGTSVVVAGIDATLRLGSAISGTVTGPDGVTPLEYMSVAAWRKEIGGTGWSQVRWAGTDEDGSYRFGKLDPGTYRLQFVDNDEEIYRSEFYNNVATVEAATDIVLAPEMEVTGIDASLADGSHIAGTVTGADGGMPLQGIHVTAYQWDSDDEYWDSVRSTRSLADGSYRIRGLDAGTFRLRFYDPDGRYKTRYHAGAADVESATDIALGTDSEVSGINEILPISSRIRGVVTGPDGLALLEGIYVSAYHWNVAGEYWDHVNGRYTDAGGGYQIGGLEPGNYRLRFEDDDYEIYLTEYYNNAGTLDDAADVAVADGEEVAGIDVSLSIGSQISGVVTGPDGVTALRAIQVTAYAWDADNEYWEQVRHTYTATDGSYELPGFAPGSYRVRFFDPAGKYHSGYFNGAPDLDNATDIIVYADVDVAGIDASLARASRILGKVTAQDGLTPVEGIDVELYRWDAGSESWQYAGSTETEDDGRYAVGRLEAGDYRVGFRTYGQYGFGDEWYDNAATLKDGTDIVIAAGTDRTGINASLSEGGRISGVVTGPDGVTPLEYVHVSVYGWDEVDGSWDQIRSASTAADGSYTIRGLSEAAYRVRFVSDEGNLKSEYYDNATDIDSAADVFVAAHATVSSIDASLSDGSSISGTVTGMDGVTPLEGIQVQCHVWYPEYEYGDLSEIVYTGADGKYEFRGLEAGIYRIGFDDANAGDYFPEYYDDAADIESAVDIVLGPDDMAGGIDASMRRAATISGTVTGPDGELRLAGIRVDLYDWDAGSESGDIHASIYTADDGTYTFLGLAAGTYRVGFLDTNYGVYFDEYHADAADLETATDLVVPEGSAITGIDASLSGEVTSPPMVTGFRHMEAGWYELDFAGPAGGVFQLQQSPDLRIWTDVDDPFACQLGTNVLSTWSEEPTMFWRVRSVR